MKVMFVGYGFGIDKAADEPEADMIAPVPINFSVNVDMMLDRWGGGVAIADIEPYPDVDDVYRVTDFSTLPATYRQTGPGSVILDALDGSWFIELANDESRGVEITTSGELPRHNDDLL